MAIITAKTGTRDFDTDTDWVGDTKPDPGGADDYIIPAGCDMVSDVSVSIDGVLVGGGTITFDSASNTGVITGNGTVNFIGTSENAGAGELNHTGDVVFDDDSANNAAIVNNIGDVYLNDNAGNVNGGVISNTGNVYVDSTTNTAAISNTGDVLFTSSTNNGTIDNDGDSRFDTSSVNAGTLESTGDIVFAGASEQHTTATAGGLFQFEGAAFNKGGATSNAPRFNFISGGHNKASGVINFTESLVFGTGSYTLAIITFPAGGKVYAVDGLAALGGTVPVDNSGLPWTNDIPPVDKVEAEYEYAAGELEGELAANNGPRRIMLGAGVGI